MSSSKPRIQRFNRYNADMHVRQRFAHAHISKELKKKLNIKKRSAQVRKGDTVKVMVGKNFGKTGKVNSVDLRDSTILVDGISRKTAKGKEILVPIRISNVYITELELADKLRKAKLGVS